MCNLLGWQNLAGHVKRKYSILAIQEASNPHGTGICSNRAGKRYTLKTQTQLAGMRQADLLKMLDDKTAIAHTRYATHGKHTQENCHPFYEHSYGLALAHNGIVDDTPHRKKLKKYYKFQGQTDSESLLASIVKHKKQGKATIDAIKATIENFTGDMAITILMPDDSVYIYRSGRQLSYIETNNGMMWATNSAHLYCMAGAVNPKTLLNIKTFEAEKLYRIEQGRIVYESEKIAMKKPVVTNIPIWKYSAHDKENKTGKFDSTVWDDISDDCPDYNAKEHSVSVDENMYRMFSGR